jgi:ribosomal protein S18 acetylase RimI-like enzyme
MADIAVRTATPEDWDDLMALWIADEQEGRGVPPDAVRRGAEHARRMYDFLASESFWVLLARCEGGPAGYIHLCLIPKADERAGFVYADELYVVPAHRRKGVALALLERAAQLSEERGLTGVRLLVRPENEAARALYRKAGYEEYPTILCQRKSFRG